MHDVIVVGARVAGASTAMLMARRGLKVLVVDRAQFPSDTLSTHQVQVPGVARLRRWGVLDAVIAAGTPPTRRVRSDFGAEVLDGHWPLVVGADGRHSLVAVPFGPGWALVGDAGLLMDSITGQGISQAGIRAHRRRNAARRRPRPGSAVRPQRSRAARGASISTRP